MPRIRTWLALLGLAVVCAPAAADIYVWRDRYGVSHYTNDLANVPAEYRSTAFTVAKDWQRAEPAPEPPPAAPEPTPSPGPQSAVSVVEEPDEIAAQGVFDAGYLAGLRAAEAATVTAVASATFVPIVQFVAPEPRPYFVDGLVPVFAPPAPPRKRPRRGHEPAPVARPFAGPAGPPPLGAAGPPPFQPRSR